MRCASCGTHNEPDSRFCGGCGARLPAGENRIAPTQKIATGANEVQPRAHLVTPAPLPVVAPAPVIPHTSRPSSSPPVRPMTPLPVSPGPGPSAQAAHGGSPSAPVAAPLGSEPPRIANSLRGVSAPAPIPGTGVGPGGIPGTGVGPGGIPGTGVGGRGGIPGTGSPPRPARTSQPSAAPLPSVRTGVIVGVLVVDLCLAAAGAWMLIEGLSAAGAPAPARPESAPPGKPPPPPPSNASASAEMPAKSQP